MTLSDNAKTANRRLIVLFGLLIYLFAANMISIFLVRVPFRDALRLLMTCFGCCALASQLLNNVFSRKNVLLLLTVMLIAVVVPTLALYMGPGSRAAFTNGLLQTADAIMWISIFAWAYYIGNRSERAVEKTGAAGWCVFLLLALFIGVLREDGEQAYTLRSTAYYGAMMLPFVFMMRKRPARIAAMLAVFLMALLSAKRGVFLTVVLAVAVNYIVKFRQASGSATKLRIVLGALAVVVTGYFILQHYTREHDLGIIDRLLAIQQDEGSGRLAIWEKTWQMIKTSDSASLLFGHGFNAVYLNSPVRASAHNDFLEVLYDYGIVGFVLYAAWIVKIFAGYKQVRQRIPQLAAPYAVSLALFVGISLVSHLVLYPTYFLVLCAFWGLTMGELDRNQTIRRKV